MEKYKEDIAATRIGCLGSSDGRMLSQIATLGCVPKSAYKRLAVVKGLIPQTEIPKTDAIKAGDDLEMIIYNYLKSTDSRYESNPLWISDKYSKKNVKLISHPDLVLVDEKEKVINIYEVKTTKYNVEATRQTYKPQLYIHYIIGKEKAVQRGREWSIRLFLVHYSTEGLDLSNGVPFDISRLTIKRVKFSSSFFDVDKAMTIVDSFLDTFTEYYDGDEIDSVYLPEKVKQEFNTITNVLAEIKEREAKVEEFKKMLCDFMQEKGVKSIKNDAWAITLVQPSESVSVDYKAIFANEIEAKKPRVANKLKKQYQKTTQKRAYVTIKIKDNNE